MPGIYVCVIFVLGLGLGPAGSATGNLEPAPPGNLALLRQAPRLEIWCQAPRLIIWRRRLDFGPAPRRAKWVRRRVKLSAPGASEIIGAAPAPGASILIRRRATPAPHNLYHIWRGAARRQFN